MEKGKKGGKGKSAKRSFDIASAIGIFLAVALVFFGILVSQDKTTGTFSVSTEKLGNFFDVSSIFIVVGGTMGCLLIMYPMNRFAQIPKHLQILFMPPQYEPKKYITTVVDCAKKVRASGLLSLEEDINKIDNSFLKHSIQMIVDSTDPDDVKAQLEAWMENVEERHYQTVEFYEKGAAVAPAFGMIGTLIGLVNMLAQLSDVATVGPNMSVALITTFYGSVMANIIFIPIGNKLQVRHEEENLCMRLIYEGVKAMQSGENPKLIEEKLLHMLPEFKRTAKGKKGKAKKGAAEAE